MRRLRAGLIGSIRAWLPSRRSTAHHSGARSMTLSGQRAVGQRDSLDLFSERAVAESRHRRVLLGVPERLVSRRGLATAE